MAAGLVLLALSLFAIQPWSFTYFGQIGMGFIFPVIIAGALAAAVTSAQAFPGRATLAAGISGTATALLVWGDLYAGAALNNLLGERLPWWTEEVAAGLIFVGVPAVLVSLGAAFVLSRRFGQSPLEGN